MVAYSDIAQVNLLYEEQNKLINGVAMLDAGGTVINFTVGPPPYDPSAPVVNPSSGTMLMMMSVQIATIAPSTELIAGARAAMVARSGEITAQLTELGVTAPPPPSL